MSADGLTLPILAPPTAVERPRETAQEPAWTETEREAIARDLANAIEGEVRFGLHDRMLYSTDASLYQVEPLGVVAPASVEDAVRAVRFCAARQLPMLPRGGGTSLAGQCVNRAVVIDLSASCRAIGQVSDAGSAGMDGDGAPIVFAEPGVYVEELNAELARRGTGLFWAPDPATVRQATIGGCIGNNAAGGRSILFGRTSENLESVDVALATGERVRLGPAFGGGAGGNDGSRMALVRGITARVAEVVERLAPEIRARWPKTVRRNAGYNLDLVLQMLEGEGAYAGTGQRGLESVNLAHLIAGSEGTLAITLGATLRLRPIPEAKALAVIAFESLDEAIGAVMPILATGPSAVELLDDMVIGAARDNLTARRQVELLPMLPGRPLEAVNAVLYVEYFGGGRADEFAPKFDGLRLAIGATPHAMAVHTDPAAMLSAWRLRQAGEPLLHGIPGERKPITFIEDNAVPPERLGEFVRRLRAIVERHGTRAAFWAHASVGVLHVRPLLSIRSETDRRILREIALEAADLARELGGVMSGEHGDGRVRGPLLERFYGREVCEGFAAIKRAFDPKGLLNPGNIVGAGPVESITTELRVAPGAGDREVRVAPIDTYYAYADQHGFGHAVEQCNGAGVCRRRQGGTMCPSYMALQDERHATRGRANALRLAITGQLQDGELAGAPAWNDAETLQTLDLCLSCKACKSECPSNVDVARLKAEYLAQGFREGGGRAWRSGVMAGIRALNRAGAAAPVVANFVNGLAPVRAAIGALMDVHPKRSLPGFGPSLERWHARRARRTGESASGGARAVVALFADCFCSFNEPHIGRAAVALLETLGYDVVIPRTGCCARPAMSLGLLPNAMRTADATLDALAPLIDDDACRAILVLEPSCLSAFKDDWLDLRLQTPMDRRRRLASKAWLVEDFIERAWAEHPRRAAMERALDAADAPPAILHAHCHQKALWGAESSAALLRRALGDRLTVLDSGCCGMAGSFGYSRRRFDLSMRIGELSLLPSVRAAPAEAPILAPGTSCRHQIKDGAGRTALHPVEFLARLVGAPGAHPETGEA